MTVPRRWAACAAAAAALTVSAAGADGAERGYADRARSAIDLRSAIGTAGVRTLRRGGAPVLFPARYVTWAPGPLAVQLFSGGGYEIQVYPLPDCRADDLNCPMFSIRAERGADPPERVDVRLHGGVRGWFRPRTCDLGCSGPTVEFARAGVVYRFDGPVVGNGRRALLALANRALAAGPR